MCSNTKEKINNILTEIEMINAMINKGYNKEILSKRYNRLYNELSCLLNNNKLN